MPAPTPVDPQESQYLRARLAEVVSAEAIPGVAPAVRVFKSVAAKSADQAKHTSHLSEAG